MKTIENLSLWCGSVDDKESGQLPSSKFVAAKQTHHLVGGLLRVTLLLKARKLPISETARHHSATRNLQRPQRRSQFWSGA